MHSNKLQQIAKSMKIPTIKNLNINFTAFQGLQNAPVNSSKSHTRTVPSSVLQIISTFTRQISNIVVMQLHGQTVNN